MRIYIDRALQRSSDSRPILLNLVAKALEKFLRTFEGVGWWFSRFAWCVAWGVSLGCGTLLRCVSWFHIEDVVIMNLKALTKQDLLLATERLVAQERRITSQILWHLYEIERRRLFAELGFASLFE